MEHKDYIENKDLGKLVDELGDLRYDKLSDFLYYLSLKLKNDSKKDKDKNKIKLSERLLNSSNYLFKASEEISLAYDICKPYMKNK